MKAFISYSLTDQEEYIATLLSYKLRESGFSLIISNNSEEVDNTTTYQIFVSQLFVGLVTLQGHQWQRVLQEYQIAVQNSIPAILLVEEGVPINRNFAGHYVIFNRNSPQSAIDEINNRMIQNRTKTNNDALGWILGGAALLGIIALLSNDTKK